MAEARQGDTVRVHYTGKLDDGSVFDSSRGRDPLEFTLGSGQVIPGFEKAISGMEPGDEKEITIAAGDAYGDRRDDLLLAVGHDQFPDEIDPEPGQQLQMSREGQNFLVTVSEVRDDGVVLDANHPLAGKDLTFALELVEIV